MVSYPILNYFGVIRGSQVKFVVEVRRLLASNQGIRRKQFLRVPCTLLILLTPSNEMPCRMVPCTSVSSYIPGTPGMCPPLGWLSDGRVGGNFQY